MIKNLVIVESPAKAKTIEKFLGADYHVVSSYGHIRDLTRKQNGVEIENGFNPLYEVPADKKQVVSDLKKLSAKSETVWLATDEDREGEAISWHLAEVLNLDISKTKRIVFNEITKEAIVNAIKTARRVDTNLVYSQQARRILDRLVGFEISPVLWRKVKSSLSAGRVQSVAVRLIVEREREIDAFNSESKFRVTALFYTRDAKKPIRAELSEKFDNEKDASSFLEMCRDALFSVSSLEKKPVKKSPAPPFTTSTLQQEASRKYRFSVSRTMLVAQKLYESGKITYMRTDSVNLSEQAIAHAAQIISDDFGKEYSHPRRFKTKSETAQEAHEAIRPTYFETKNVEGSREEKLLYDLIWKRTVASQMKDAALERTTIKINVSTRKEYFTAQGEVIKFDGFLKVYLESSDDEDSQEEDNEMLPVVREGEKLNMDHINASERFSRPSARYTEATLVRKLEELGIGRPSTYAPTISTIQKRGYVNKEDRPGSERKYRSLTLDAKGKITAMDKSENFGAEKSKLFPSDVAMLVNDFLIQNFPRILDFKFTAAVEKELDDIAQGKLVWNEMLRDFYEPFHESVKETIESSEKVKGERTLGNDPSGKLVTVRLARFGPVAQLTDPDDPEAKPQFASLRPGQRLETITLAEALSLFRLPRNIGVFEEKAVSISIGRFGPYAKHDNKFYSLGKGHDPYTVEIEDVIGIIEAKRKTELERNIKSFEDAPDIQVLNGRWGPFIKAGKENIKIPKGKDPKELTLDEIRKLIAETGGKKSPAVKKSGGRKK
ncbi:MAG: type I DNA topoisomerase [Ignavibacteriales bacterium]|nr:type I DNA topoisomerase [Ignavibacteriales bacterium]MCF8305849.1 type I DNA topoisomerase [Ignavibacteriales bacterium]MCF8315571.1 type I DNA topoisomerase [Ignavibacteriales bacterium]MCF8436899.1 type I DNA topoisomerase [Ignavibacteriales bacterium]